MVLGEQIKLIFVVWEPGNPKPFKVQIRVEKKTD